MRCASPSEARSGRQAGDAGAGASGGTGNSSLLLLALVMVIWGALEFLETIMSEKPASRSIPNNAAKASQNMAWGAWDSAREIGAWDVCGSSAIETQKGL